MSGDLAPQVEFGGDDRPTGLYRLFGAGSALLYVGICGNVGVRMSQHAAEKQWWPEVVRKTVVLYPSRAAAEVAEAIAVRDERPRYNIARPVIRPPVAPDTPYRLPEKDALDFIKAILYATQADVCGWLTYMITTGEAALGPALAAVPVSKRSLRP